MAHLTEIESKGAADLDTVSPRNLLLREQHVQQQIHRGGAENSGSFALSL